MYLDIDLATLYTWERSTKFEPFLVGVPTQIKITCDSLIAFSKSLVKYNRFDLN